MTPFAKLTQFVHSGESVITEEIDGFLERRIWCEFRKRIPANNQFASLSVDTAETCLRDGDSFQPLVR